MKNYSVKSSIIIIVHSMFSERVAGVPRPLKMCAQCIQIHWRLVYLSHGLKDLENIDSDMFNKSRSGRQPILNEEHLKRDY